jgi:hypothetical protein
MRSCDRGVDFTIHLLDHFSKKVIAMMLSVLLLGFGVSLSVAIPHDILITAGPSVNLQPRATPAGEWTFGPGISNLPSH